MVKIFLREGGDYLNHFMRGERGILSIKLTIKYVITCKLNITVSCFFLRVKCVDIVTLNHPSLIEDVVYILEKKD